MRILTLILIALFSLPGLFMGFGITLVLIATNNTVSGSRGYLYPLIPFDGRAIYRLIFRVKLKGKKC
jgi:stage V sporulation protein AF